MPSIIGLLFHLSKSSFKPALLPQVLGITSVNECKFCQKKLVSSFTANQSSILVTKKLKHGIISSSILLFERKLFNKAFRNLTFWPKTINTTENKSGKKLDSFNERLKKNLYKVGVVLPEKYSNTELSDAAKVLLNGIYMQVPHKTIREIAGLEDSFIMWLKVVYLHIWLVSCQLYSKGGRDGEILVSNMLSILWEDIQERLNHFQDELKQNLQSKKMLRESYNEMIKFFVLLDEGILHGDAMLASSLWALIYTSNSFGAEIWHIENLVHYLRLMSARLQDVDFEFFVLRHDELDWQFPQPILDMVEQDEQKWR